MPRLLHEYWENDEGGCFGPVREDDDTKRPLIMPNAKLAFNLWASSWEEGAQARNDKLGWGRYVPAEGVQNYFYSEEEAATQVAYLLIRRLPDN